jgi:PAS domain S-box-containing protein
MFEQIFDHLPDAILIVGRDGRIQQANARAETLFGYARGALTGLKVEALVPAHCAPRHEQNRNHYFSYPHVRPMGSGLELTARRQDGSEFPVDITLGPLGEGKDAVVCAVRDMTEHRQLVQALAAKNAELHGMTQQLWQTAKLATMGELAASIAHELNNPLGIVSLRVEALLAAVPPDDPQHRALEIIAQEIERMGSLVANLLQFSRQQSQQVSTLDVREELEHAIELLHYHLRKRGIEVVRDFSAVVPAVQADRQRLRQVFLNLFANAADAMVHGGRLSIRVGGAAQCVAIDITDTGSGIAAADLPKVMEPFYTTKPEGSGTGLGLAICRRIMHEHHGELTITSPGPGRGTTVRLRLPFRNGTNGRHMTQP